MHVYNVCLFISVCVRVCLCVCLSVPISVCLYLCVGSPRYICYGVRGGSVRVIHQTTGQRLLQKGHTSVELTDLCIHGDGDECRLAAGARANSLTSAYCICVRILHMWHS